MNVLCSMPYDISWDRAKEKRAQTPSTFHINTYTHFSYMLMHPLFFLHCKLFPLTPYIPCWKYDMDSHGNSSSFHVPYRRQFGPNSHQIPWLFHVIYLFFMLQHDMDFGQVQVMEFPWHLLRKWRDFPCGFGLIFEPNQTAVKKTWENIKCHIFYRGMSPKVIINNKILQLLHF